MVAISRSTDPDWRAYPIWLLPQVMPLYYGRGVPFQFADGAWGWTNIFESMVDPN